MSVRPYRDIYRRQSRRIHVGAVAVGGGAPISVQSMTNTLTSDAAATIAQVRALEEAGADIVRVSCPDEASTAALAAIVEAAQVPIVADIHFHYKRAIEAAGPWRRRCIAPPAAIPSRFAATPSRFRPLRRPA